ncbi:hypothetical protein KKE78_03980, partial [Patescibacteria group bacterium]|nr:hypothetical protein [Patescibacteria group bacterium]
MRNKQKLTLEKSCSHLRDVLKTVQSQAGQNLIEVMVAVTIGILVVTALTFATIFSLRNANFAKNSAQATKLAQEGIERVRSGRDRNLTIGGSFGYVVSWDGISSDLCDGSTTVKEDSIWCYQIYDACAPNCYFNVTDEGELNYIIPSPSMPSFAEQIAPNFKRVVILSDVAGSY